MADFTLDIGIDTGISFENMKSDISTLISRLNGEQYKVKVGVEIDQASIDNFRSQITSMQSSLLGTGKIVLGDVDTSRIDNAVGSVENISTNVQNAVSNIRSMRAELDAVSASTLSDALSSVSGLTAEGAANVTRALEGANVQISKAKVLLKEVAGEEQNLVSLHIKGTNEIGQSVSQLIKFDVKTGEIVSKTTEIGAIWQDVKSQAASASASMENGNSGLESTEASLTQISARLTEIQLANKSINAEYASLKGALGGENAAGRNASDVELMKQKYIEYMNLIEQVKVSKSSATQEDINNIYATQAQLQSLMDSIRERINLEQEAAKASQNASTASTSAAEAEAAAERKAAEESENRQKQSQRNEQERQQLLSRSYTLLKQMQDAEQNWTAAKNGKSSAYYVGIQNDIASLDSLILKFKEGTISAEDFKTSLKTFNASFKENANVIRMNSENTKTWSERIGGLSAKFTTWFSITRVIMAAYRAIREMVSAVKELDTAMTELKKVTDETESTYSSFMSNASSKAKDVGAKVSDFIESTSDFARLGYNIEDASKLAEVSTIYKNVGDGITDISDASESIISTMKAFGIEASDAMMIVDKFNNVGNKFAISSGGIGESLLRSASAMKAANNTLDETIALSTAANTIVQDPEKVGTAMKTLSMYLRAAKTEAEDAGESTDGMASSVSELRSEILSLTNNKVDIQIDENTFKSTYQIIKELSQVWGELYDVDKANILEMIAGKRNSNVVSALLENFNIAEDALKASYDAAGSAMAENEKYLESVNGKISIMKASFETFSETLISSDVLKFFIDAATGVLDFSENTVKLIDSLGGLKTILVSIAGILIASKLESIKGTLNGVALSFTSFIGKITELPTAFRIAKSEGKGLSGALELVGISASSAQIAIVAVTAAITIAIAAYSRWRNKIEQQRQEMISSSKESAQEAKNIIDLYSAYQTANDAYKSNTGSKDALTESTSALLAALGYEQSEIDSLVEKYGSLDDAINSVTLDSLRKSTNDAKSGLNAAYDDLKDSFGIGSNPFSKIASFFGYGKSNKFIEWNEGAEELNTKIGEILTKAKVIDGTNGGVGKTAGAIFVEGKSVESIIESYDRLIEAKKALQENLSSDEYSNSNAVDVIERQISDMEPTISEYLSARKLLNESLAKEDVFSSLSNNGIPKTVDELSSLKESLIEAAASSDRFKGSSDDIKNAFDNAFNELGDTFPGLSDIINQSISEASKATKEQLDELRNSFAKQEEISIKSQVDRNAIKDIEEYRYAYENLLNEQQKIKDWNLTDFGNAFDTSGNSFVQTVFGNIDMDKRTIITWSEELKKTYADALSSWDYNPEIGCIDTVFGGSDRFGEDVLKSGVEIAFTPIMNVNGKAEFLDRNTVYDYINDLVGESTIDGVFSEEKLLNLDKQGKQIGDTFVKGIIAAADEGLNYDNNGNWAETVGRLMHFSGEFGSISLAYQDISQKAKDAKVSTEDFISAFQDAENENVSESITEWFDALSDDDKQLVYQIKIKSDDTSSWSLSKWKEELDKLSNTNKNIDIKIDIEAETKGIEALNTAMSESASAAGLSAESVEKLESRYKNLKNYDASKLFEKTANGIHINTKALEELESTYEEQNVTSFKNQIEDLTEQYDLLTNKIENCSDESERADLYAQRDSVLERIEDTSRLATQYDGLTSAYQKWIEAQNKPTEREGYENMGEGYEKTKKLIEQGWSGDSGVTEYLDLLLSADQRTQDNITDFDKLTKKIKGTKFSIMDFFQYDKDNNLVSDGLFNFLDTVKAKLGSEFVQVAEDGTYAFDFTGDKINQVADALGMSTEAVQLLERAMIDAGFDVVFDSGLTDMEQFKSSATECADKLSEMGLTEYKFNFDTKSIDSVDEQIEESRNILKQFTNEDGTINLDIDGAEEAKTVLKTLIYRKSELENPMIMSIDVDGSKASSEIEKAIGLLQQFKNANAELEFQAAIGADTTDAQKKVNDLLSQMSKNQIITGELQIDTTSVDTALSSINNLKDPEILIHAGLDSSKIDGYTPEPKDAKVTFTKDSKEVDEYNPKDLTRTVTFKKDSIEVDKYNPKDIKRTVTYTLKVVGEGLASGTVGNKNITGIKGIAKAHGDWRTKRDGIALGGELGQELIVRDGRFFTIGDDSAEFFHYKKGDIIFNAEQTRQILNNGKIGSGDKRGTAFVEGTAFDSGSGGRRRKNDSKGTHSASGKNSSSSSGGRSSSKTSSSSTKNKSNNNTKGKDDDKDKESEFERQYKKHQHLLAMEKESEAEYLKWLNKAYKEAYKNKEIELDDYYKYQEEVYQGRQDLFKDHLSDIEHEISMRENYDGETKNIISLYKGASKDIEKEIAKARARGLDDTDDYIQELQSKWQDYQNNIDKLKEEAKEGAKDALDELVDYRIDMIKQDLNNEKDALEKKLDNLKSFYDRQKEALQDERDEEKYLKEQSEKRKSVSTIQEQLAMLGNDDSAWAQKRRLELEEELSKAKEDLDEFEDDHAYDMTIDALDKSYEKQEALIDKQISAIEEKLNNPKALYNQALSDIKNNTGELYKEMIAYNRKYGTGNDQDVKDIYNAAYDAFELYADVFGKNYQGIDLPNSTNQKSDNKSWDNEKISGASNKSGSNKNASNGNKPSNGTKTSTPSLKKGSTVKIKKTATHFGSKSKSVKMASFVPGSSFTVYNVSGDQVLIGKNGAYTGWVKKSDIVGYAKGTKKATAGLHRIDEIGSEYLFTSKDGSHYRMLNDGDKVLNAGATDFLYKFANSNGKILGNIIKSVTNSNSLSRINPSSTNNDIRMGDIIINGNADRKTVSEIRRAQRESLTDVLKSFNKLNK